MKRRVSRIAGIIGAILLGLLDGMVWLNGNWNKVLGKPMDLLAIPVKLLIFPFSLVVNNQDDLMGPYVILTFAYYAGIGFFLGRLVIYIWNKLVRTPVT
jgi:hypothetical protein